MDDGQAILHRLEAERAIAATLYRYGDALDQGGRNEFLDCFTPDSTYRVEPRLGSASGMFFEGHDQLGAYFDGHTHAPDAFHKHVTINPLVTVNGTQADVQSYFMRVDSPQAGPAVVLATGRYIDSFQQGDDGKWRIQSRRCLVENL